MMVIEESRMLEKGAPVDVMYLCRSRHGFQHSTAEEAPLKGGSVRDRREDPEVAGDLLSGTQTEGRHGQQSVGMDTRPQWGPAEFSTGIVALHTCERPAGHLELCRENIR